MKRCQVDEVVDNHVEADIFLGPLGEHLLVDVRTIRSIAEVMTAARTTSTNP